MSPQKFQNVVREKKTSKYFQFNFLEVTMTSELQYKVDKSLCYFISDTVLHNDLTSFIQDVENSKNIYFLIVVMAEYFTFCFTITVTNFRFCKFFFIENNKL